MATRRSVCVGWEIVGDKAILTYDNGEKLTVRKPDFDRAFGCIVSADYDVIKRDFAI